MSEERCDCGGTIKRYLTEESKKFKAMLCCNKCHTIKELERAKE